MPVQPNPENKERSMFEEMIRSGELWSQWTERRQEVRKRILETMGVEPFLNWKPIGKWLREKLLFGCSARDFMIEILPGFHCMGTLVLPKNVLPGSPLVFCIHGTAPAGRLNVLNPEKFPNRCYGIELVHQGIATCSLDLFGFGEWCENGKGRAELHSEFYRIFPDWSLDGIWLRTHRMAIDWLTALPEYRFSGIGAIGNSLGGRVSVYLAALEERISAVVVSCGISPNQTNIYRNLPGIARGENSPRLNAETLTCGKPPWEYQELLALIAPRSLLAVEPFNDPYNPYPFASAECFDRASRVWKLANVPERAVLLYHGMGHDVPPEIRHFAYEFFEKHLLPAASAKNANGRNNENQENIIAKQEGDRL